MANLLLPNFVDSYNQGYDRGQQQRLNMLAGQAIAAPSDQRKALLGKAAQIDPGTALAVGNQLSQRDKAEQSAQDAQIQRVGNAARFMLNAIKSGNPSAVDGAYQAVRPLLAQTSGREPPPNYSPDMQPQIEQIVAHADAMRAPEPTVVGGNIVDKNTGQVLFHPQAQPKTMTVGGSLLSVGPDGQVRVLYKGEGKAQKPSAMEQRIALARAMGATPEQVKQMVLGTNGNITPDVPGDHTATGDAYLQTLDPQTAAQVKALAEGRMAFPTGTALRSPYWQGMLGAVSQYDPSFDAVNYNARSKTRSGFTSGKEAQTVNALNTVAEHLGTLSDYADALNNTRFPLLNRVANTYLAETGDPRIARFNTAKKAAADEVARVWRATGGSEADIQENLKNLDGAQSPEQLHAAIGTLVKLIGGKLAALQDQYQQGMGTTQQAKPLVSPEARSAYEKVLQRAGMTDQNIGGAPAVAPTAGWSIQRID